MAIDASGLILDACFFNKCLALEGVLSLSGDRSARMKPASALFFNSQLTHYIRSKDGGGSGEDETVNDDDAFFNTESRCQMGFGTGHTMLVRPTFTMLQIHLKLANAPPHTYAFVFGAYVRRLPLCTFVTVW